ncbi:hypothetical protein MATL_G00166740 [Megalops atlanticus]|uniref:Forty-two-three domain-containing protein 1 n=1 Tax=Megalops atlanticus TaxID=7932 RepID=A0A9D3T7N6_MEGAT|nr:hypothetical protein MATL_G00166740 [Megalops atlanticus]
MGDNGAESEKMEVSHSSEKIDMTLDEIIQLNKKEQKSASGAPRVKNKRAANRNSVLRKLDREGQQRFPFKRGAYQYQQGPYRPRFIGPYRQGFYRRRPNNLRKATPGGSGLSPLNRKPWSAKSADANQPKAQAWFSRRFYQPYRGPPRALRRAPQPYRGQKFQPAQQKQGQKARPITLNREFPAQKTNDKIGRYQKVRRWRATPSTGSILTVSVPNPKATPESQAKVKQSPVTDRPSDTGSPSPPQPRGILLRFNFKAVANQTGVSLNDRFTGLKIRGGASHRPWRGRGRGKGRTVTMQ